jgi:hypothetical protein
MKFYLNDWNKDNLIEILLLLDEKEMSKIFLLRNEGVKT